MTSTSAVAVAGLMHFILHTSFFIEQSKDLCSPAPAISSWIFLIACLDILSDIQIYPVRYMHLPFGCQFIAETLLAVLLTEFGAIVIWCTIERLLYTLVKSVLLVVGLPACVYSNWESYILGASTTIVSLIVLTYVGQATDHFHMIKKKYSKMQKKVLKNLENIWHVANDNDHCKTRSPMRSPYAAFICKDTDECMEQCFQKRRGRRCK